MVLKMAQYKTHTLYSSLAGSFLRRMLKDNGYTQERFAEEFGVSTRHVRRWLHGGINSLDTVQQLLTFFDAEVGDVFKTEDVPDRFFCGTGRNTSLRAAVFRGKMPSNETRRQQQYELKRSVPLSEQAPGACRRMRLGASKTVEYS
ncbi:MAG: helix-turn-helix transcriptional regulator [Clostridia bacterium]|nr:helix-turn-helix transcriptional regulator [Clostridia bacterium]